LIYAFDGCELDTQRREFRRAGGLGALEPQVFDVLQYLLEQRDRVIPKDELFDRIWGHRFVTEATLSSRIMAARKAIGDDGKAQRLIKTVHGRGFRFVGDVDALAPEVGPTADGREAVAEDEAPSPVAMDSTSRLPVGPAGVESDGADETSRPASSLPNGTVTFLFFELEGGAGLHDSHVGGYREATVRCHKLLRDAVETHGGTVFETGGDAIYAAFAAPGAAVEAALAGQTGLREETCCSADRLRARVGIHTGEVARVGTHYFGAAVHWCTRITAAAHRGQVLISEATAAMVRDALPAGADIHELGIHRLRDVPRPERLFQLVHPALDATFPPLRASGAQPHNLPRQLTNLVGRNHEAAEVRLLLTEAPLVTLAGPGGSGKTRLALRVAQDLLAAAESTSAGMSDAGVSEALDITDGVWFADLAPLVDGALVPQAVAAAIGIQEVPGQPLAATLLQALSQRALLLVLDNCEHLLDACAPLVEAMLRAAPRLLVLATSREPLRAAGEVVYRVPPLAIPDPTRPGPLENIVRSPASRLFVERARAVSPTFTVTAQNAAAVAQVCARLDGLPLAIELAAARVKVLSVEQIAARLDDRFRLLTDGGRTAGRRHQTLRAALDWSHDLLTPAEGALFRRLSVFPGGWTLEAAEAVAYDQSRGESTGYSAGQRNPASGSIAAGDVLDLLASLIDKSLVVAGTGDDVTGMLETAGDGAPRYRFPETIRQYALERLQQSGDAIQAGEAHAAYFLALAERVAPELQRRQQAQWHERLEVEHDNLRAALAWYVERGDAMQALRLAGALHWFWYRQRHWDEGYTWPARVLALPAAKAPTPMRAAVLEGGALFAMWRDPDAAQAMWEESIAISMEAGDSSRAALTSSYLAWMHVRRRQLAEARHRAEAAHALARQSGNPSAISNALALLAAVASMQGEHSLARARHEEALVLRRATDNVGALSLLLLDMAKAAFRAGDSQRTRDYAEDALRTAREAGIRQAVEEELRLIVRVALAQGDLVAAETRAAELVAHMRGRGRGAEVDALPVLGQVAQAAGDTTRATALYREALELARRLPGADETQPALYRDTGDQPGVALALEGTATLIVPQQPALALGLAAAAAALRDREQQPLTPAEDEALRRQLAQAVSHFGAGGVWPDLVSSGTAMTVKEAIGLALEALETVSPVAVNA
jgi:predicted ATPase/class 3 adenylate cyclase